MKGRLECGVVQPAASNQQCMCVCACDDGDAMLNNKLFVCYVENVILILTVDRFNANMYAIPKNCCCIAYVLVTNVRACAERSGRVVAVVCCAYMLLVAVAHAARVGFCGQSSRQTHSASLARICNNKLVACCACPQSAVPAVFSQVASFFIVSENNNMHFYSTGVRRLSVLSVAVLPAPSLSSPLRSP